MSDSEEPRNEAAAGKSKLSRRAFLRGASSCIVLASGLAGHDAGEAAQLKSPIPKAIKFLTFDPALCTGCGTCQMVCSTLWNNGKASLELSRIKVQRNPFGTSDDNYAPIPCLQCVDAPCLKACPVGAIKVDRSAGTAARVVDEKLCKGLKECIAACPYDDKRIAFNDETKKAMKCHLCHGEPSCVKWCPNGALRYGGPPEFNPTMEYMPEVSGKPMVSKSYMVVDEESRRKELGYPREEK